MSEVRLVVREAEHDWAGTMHASDADRVVAALSADPVTLEELESAVRRFASPTPDKRFFGNLRPGLDTQPHDAGLVVIDLAARLVVVDSTYASAEKTGAVEYHDGLCCTDKWLRYHLADDWLFLSDGEHWEHAAMGRRQALAARPMIDARAVFYGRPLIEFIAAECFAAFARREEIVAAARTQWIEKAVKRLADETNVSPESIDVDRLTDEEITPETWPGQERYASPFYNTLKQIHAAWLLTPREDLGGRCPREVALERHDHLTWDLEDRCLQWSRLDECPPPLATSTHAFRLGGFGTHELVMHYDFVRELLWSCWARLAELGESPEGGHRFETLSVDDFLAEELPRLEKVGEVWLDMPNPEHRGRTPRSIIDRERARMPEGSSGREAFHDPDCPCCQMMDDMPGPWFWHLDGSGMDDEFAFNLWHATREEWEEERREWDERHRRFNAEWAERERLGVTSPNPHTDDSGAVWSRSFYVGDTADVPLGIRLFGFGCRLAEVIADLRGESESTPPEKQRHIDQLNCDFGNLRELLQNAESSLTDSLLDPVLDRFGETLAALASDYPDLGPKCESLASSLRTLADPPPPEEDLFDEDDDDHPF